MERFTISLDEHLAESFDQWIAARGYANRSEAVRDLFRAELERARRHEMPREMPCVASLSYVYNHRERELGERLRHMQAAHHDVVLSSMQVHLDHEHCLESVMLRGPVGTVQSFADRVTAERGVHHGTLNLISVETHQHHHHGDPRQPHIHVKPAT